MGNSEVSNGLPYVNRAALSLFSSEIANFVPLDLTISKTNFQTLLSWSKGVHMSKEHTEFITFTTKAIVKQK